MIIRPPDEFYALVSSELQAGIRDEGAWAKAFARSGGHDGKAQALYLDARADKLYQQAIKAQKNAKTIAKNQSNPPSKAKTKPKSKTTARSRPAEVRDGIIIRTEEDRLKWQEDAIERARLGKGTKKAGESNQSSPTTVIVIATLTVFGILIFIGS